VVPTLTGRIQTRIFLLAVVGGLITLIIVPILPGSAPLGDKYRDGFLVLLSVAVIGVLWELLYHLLMQWRWEKDWPTLFGRGSTGRRADLDSAKRRSHTRHRR
jgi:hypothetical protein